MNAAESFVPLALKRATTPADRSADRDGFVPAKPAAAETAPRTGASGATGPAPHAGSAPASVVAPRPHVEHGRPIVTLQRDGDQVTGIRIECTCGNVIELDCLY